MPCIDAYDMISCVRFYIIVHATRLTNVVDLRCTSVHVSYATCDASSQKLTILMPRINKHNNNDDINPNILM